MDHIFGDSDDISFGSSQSDVTTTQNTRQRTHNNNQRHQSSPVHSNKTHSEKNFSKTTNQNQFRPRPQRAPGTPELAVIDNTPSLSRLIA